MVSQQARNLGLCLILEQYSGWFVKNLNVSVHGKVFMRQRQEFVSFVDLKELNVNFYYFLCVRIVAGLDIHSPQVSTNNFKSHHYILVTIIFLQVPDNLFRPY